MARKSKLSKAADTAKILAGTATRRLRRPRNAVRTVAGAALGAAAIAATGLVAKKVADAIRERGEQVAATPDLQRMLVKTVSQPWPKRRKRAAAARQPKAPRKKTGSTRPSRKRARASRGRR